MEHLYIGFKNKNAQENSMDIRLIKASEDKDMANGRRDMSGRPLTDKEIEIVKEQIKRINADQSIFVFNDASHIRESTCYNFKYDVIYVTRNVFPDNKYGSTHPRDVMSIAAVLAHEYYGHRLYREEYLSDMEKGDDYHTTPLWQDECRASINAAKLAPNLNQKERSDLIMDAVYRAQEYGNLIEMDDYMKEVVYGYSSDEKNITPTVQPITFVSEAGKDRNDGKRMYDSNMSKMPRTSYDYNDFER